MSDECQRPRAPGFARAITLFAFLLLYVPLVALMVYSFRVPVLAGAGTIEAVDSVSGWTLEWYRRVFVDARVLEALRLSCWVGLWTTVISTLIGTVAALALERAQFRGKGLVDALTYVPLIMPEIVMGLSLLIWFVAIKLTLGAFSVILAHVTFSVSYVIITVKARLQGFDVSLEEAARDLGASSWQTFWKVTFPLIWPGILSGALMAFTLSFDDFLITFFTAGPGNDTLPVKIYGMIKFGVTPEIHALSTLMLLATLALVLLFFKPDKEMANTLG